MHYPGPVQRAESENDGSFARAGGNTSRDFPILVVEMTDSAGVAAEIGVELAVAVVVHGRSAKLAVRDEKGDARTVEVVNAGTLGSGQGCGFGLEEYVKLAPGLGVPDKEILR